jgi:hypothetical protein
VEFPFEIELLFYAMRPELGGQRGLLLIQPLIPDTEEARRSESYVDQQQ